MHRRPGRGRGISLSPSLNMLDEKSPRRHPRSFSRIWALLLALVALLAFSLFIYPALSAAHSPQINYSNADLSPINYFNLSNSPANPFPFCPVYGPNDELGRKYGPVVLSKSRLHHGSGGRIQRVLNQALAGQPVTISVIGGSISACHGAGDDPISPKCYPSKFFQWWNSVFPHPVSELTNGAMRRTNSAYFAFCNAHHLPDLTDLVIIELDTDDPPGEENMEHFENLIRSILLRPSQPAVLLLGHFAPQIHTAHGFAGPEQTHTLVSQFYDLPHLSSKSLLFPQYMKDPQAVGSTYYADAVLANPRGHDVLTDVLVAYFQSQICVAWGVAMGNAFDAVPLHTGIGLGAPGGAGEGHALFGGIGLRKGVPEPGAEDSSSSSDSDDDAKADAASAAAAAEEAKAAKLKAESASKDAALAHNAQLTVPPGRISTRPGTSTGMRPFEEIAPFCVSANDLINPLPPSLFYGSGWFAWHPSSSSGGNANNANAGTSAHYWYSTLPTSKIRIPIQVGAGDVGVYYLREPVREVGEGSAVECWVDDNYGGAKVIENAGGEGDSSPRLFMIDKFVARGSHFVECQLLGEEGQGVPSFKIIGIFSS